MITQEFWFSYPVTCDMIKDYFDIHIIASGFLMHWSRTICTYQSPWSRVLVKQIITELVKKFSIFYGT